MYPPSENTIPNAALIEMASGPASTSTAPNSLIASGPHLAPSADYDLAPRREREQGGLQPALSASATAHSLSTSSTDPSTSPRQSKLQSTSAKGRGRRVNKDKRSQHNWLERRRREDLANQMTTLANLIPELSDIQKPSKSLIVEKARDTILQLRQMHDSALSRIHGLENTKRLLELSLAENGINVQPQAKHRRPRMESYPSSTRAAEKQLEVPETQIMASVMGTSSGSSESLHHVPAAHDTPYKPSRRTSNTQFPFMSLDATHSALTGLDPLSTDTYLQQTPFSWLQQIPQIQGNLDHAGPVPWHKVASPGPTLSIPWAADLQSSTGGGQQSIASLNAPYLLQGSEWASRLSNPSATRQMDLQGKSKRKPSLEKIAAQSGIPSDLEMSIDPMSIPRASVVRRKRRKDDA